MGVAGNFKVQHVWVETFLLHYLCFTFIIGRDDEHESRSFVIHSIIMFVGVTVIDVKHDVSKHPHIHFAVSTSLRLKVILGII